MLTRLGPVRYVVAAVVALLVAAVFAAVNPPEPVRTQPPVPRFGPDPAPAQSEPARSEPAQLDRPAPRIGPAKLVYKVETVDPVVFLTIDDGAFRDPVMADILKSNGIRAAFFLTDRYVRQDPGFFRRLRDATGSVIENHTATHPNLKGRPVAEQSAEIGPVADRYAAEFGARPTLFRAPFGSSDEATLQAAGEAGAKYVVNWGSEVSDGRIRFSGPREFRPGSIVLMHFRPSFAADVSAFMAQARRNGLKPALLTDYLT